jgi:ribosomal protein L40E
MLALLIGGLIALVCLAVVCAPFLRSRRSQREQSPTDGAGAVHAWAVQELRALETERAVGDVSEEEFLKRRQELRLTAARSLRDQAAASPEQCRIDDEVLEAEVMAVRQAKSRRLVCPLCGASVAAGASECQRCGAKLSQPFDANNTAPHA